MSRTIEEQIKHYCAYQERSHYETQKKLYELGANKEEADELIAVLIQENYLNEERYAKAYAGGKFRMKQWGKQKIIQGLKKQYISDYCIKKGLAEIDDRDYKKVLQALFEKKSRTLTKDENKFSRMAKIKAYLVQKGYSYEDINPLLQNV